MPSRKLDGVSSYVYKLSGGLEPQPSLKLPVP